MPSPTERPSEIEVEFGAVKPGSDAPPPVVGVRTVDPASTPDDIDGSPGGHRRSSVRISVDARGMALAILATVAVVAALKVAEVFFISLMIGILLAFSLNPVVDRLERWKVRRQIGATVLMGLLAAAITWAGYASKEPLQSLIEDIPDVAAKIATIVQSTGGGGLTRVREAVRQVQQAAQGVTPGDAGANAGNAANAGNGAGSSATAPQPSTPALSRPSPRKAVAAAAGGTPAAAAPESGYGGLIMSGSLGIASMLGQATMVTFLVFFLLLAGDTFKRKLVKIAGPTLTQKKVTVKILDDITVSIQRYMGVLALTNVLVGVLTGLMLWMMGFDNPAGLGVAAGLLHVVPYLGPVITAALLAVTGLVQHNELGIGLIAAGGSLVIATIVGMLITTWMTGRIARMNATAVFISLLFWGWLWGAWGLLLGVPIIMIVKVVTQHVEELEPISELLGE